MESQDALVIPAGAEVRGRVVARGLVEVRGRLEGELEAREVRIERGGEAIARITATRIDVFGALIGLANAHEVIVIHPGATASGRLSAPRVDISPDALVDESTAHEPAGVPPSADGAVRAPSEDGFESEVTQRLQLDASPLARLRGTAPRPSGDGDGRSPRAEARRALPDEGRGPSPSPAAERRPPVAPRPPTRARLTLKPRGGS